MKKVYLIILMLAACFSVQQVFAQDGDVTWGPVQKAEGDFNGEIIGSDENGYYICRKTVSDDPEQPDATYTLERYNRNHERESANDVVFKNAKKKKTVEKIIYLNGKLIVFCTWFDAKENKNVVYAQFLNGENGETTGHPVQVDVVLSEKKGAPTPWGGIAISKDKTKILVHHQEFPVKGQNQVFSYHMIDATDLHVLWERQIELPYAGKSVDITQYQVDEAGTIMGLIAVCPEKKEKEPKKRPIYTFYILEYNNSTDRLDNYKVDLAPKYVYDVVFANDPGRGLVACAGFYSNKATGTDIAGTYFLQIDKNTQAVAAKGTKDFAKEFLGAFVNEKKGSKAKEIYRFSMDQLILKEDGGAVLVAEQYMVDKSCAPGKPCEYYYYYHDIICAGVNPDASIAWVSKVAKHQETENDRAAYSSYIFGMSGTRMYFIYNDNPKNLKHDASDPKREAMTSGKNALPMITTMEVASGETDTRALLNAKTDKGVVLKPSLRRQSAEKEFIIFGESGKGYKLGTLTVN